MSVALHALGIDALDPAALGRFWSGVLGHELVNDARDGVTLLPNEATEFCIRFVPTDVPKSGPNQMHFELTSSSLEEQQQTVEGVLAPPVRCRSWSRRRARRSPSCCVVTSRRGRSAPRRRHRPQA